jgi:hypothetical protein
VLLRIFFSNPNSNPEYIEKLAFEKQICPFEFSLDLSYLSDVVICDYNYYFDPRVALQREDALKNNKDILLEIIQKQFFLHQWEPVQKVSSLL